MNKARLFSTAAVVIGLLLHPTGRVHATGDVEHTLKSKILDQQRTLTVHLPSSYQQQTEFLYPVLYLLDGETNAGYAVSVSRFLAETAVTPEVITVALHAGTTRSRDYLPPNPDGAAGTGGEADRYLEHLAQELIPFIEDNYRAAPLRLISGHSMGGLLVIEALVQQPGLFEGYLAQSPYLNESIGKPLLERIGAKTAGSPTSVVDSSRVFYYFNLGEEPQLAPNFDRLQGVLAESRRSGASEASGAVEIEAGKGHMETRLVGYYKGLERFFADTWKFSPESLGQDGAAGFTAYVSRLNSTFGYKVLLNESVFQGAVQTLFSTQNPQGARTVGGLYVDYYPRSPIAHFLLANAQAGSGAREEALGSIGAAMSLYEAAPSTVLAPLYDAMNRLKSSLQPH